MRNSCVSTWGVKRKWERNGRDNDLQGVEEDERQRAPGAKRGQPGFDACPIADQVNQRGTVEHAQGQQEERQKEQA